MVIYPKCIFTVYVKRLGIVLLMLNYYEDLSTKLDLEHFQWSATEYILIFILLYFFNRDCFTGLVLLMISKFTY